MNTEKPSSLERMRSMMHIAMGVFYWIIGGLVVYVQQFGTINISAGVSYALGALLFLYGGFRIFRGISQLKAGKR